MRKEAGVGGQYWRVQRCLRPGAVSLGVGDEEGVPIVRQVGGAMNSLTNTHLRGMVVVGGREGPDQGCFEPAIRPSCSIAALEQ